VIGAARSASGSQACDSLGVEDPSDGRGVASFAVVLVVPPHATATSALTEKPSSEASWQRGCKGRSVFRWLTRTPNAGAGTCAPEACASRPDIRVT
jgi:hypothetical protein